MNQDQKKEFIEKYYVEPTYSNQFTRPLFEEMEQDLDNLLNNWISVDKLPKHIKEKEEYYLCYIDEDTYIVAELLDERWFNIEGWEIFNVVKYQRIKPPKDKQ